MRRIKIIAIYLFFILLIVLSVIYIINFFLLKKEATEESNLLNTIEINKEQVTKTETERMLQVKKLQEENPDIIGWLEIEGTKINYPVLQSSDNKYYLNHNYRKKETELGSIFLDCNYDFDIPSSNLLIYGHNTQNGEMFQNLLKYAKKDFYNKHPVIRFTTGEEDAEYEIISVFKSKIYYQSDINVFRYYFFINAQNEEEYDEYISSIKRLSLYKIKATANYGDQLITLSTCSYHTKDGRFVVVGRKK